VLTTRYRRGQVDDVPLRPDLKRPDAFFVQSGFDEQQPPYAAWTGSLAGLAELRRFHEVPNWQPIWLPEEAPATAG
jgi:hypothetical protein